MWKSIIIKDESLMFKCHIDENKNEVKLILTNFKELWYEDCTIDDILKRAKVSKYLKGFDFHILII